MVAALYGVARCGFLALFLVLAGLTVAMLLAALALPGAPRPAPMQARPLAAE